MKRSLKYKMLLAIFRMLPVKKIMASPPEKAQRIFKKGYRGVQIPELKDPDLIFEQKKAAGSIVLSIRHKEPVNKVGIYLIGGGMLKMPKPAQAKECAALAKECRIDMLLPYYPVIFNGAALPDVYEMVYQLYKETLRKYDPDNICIMGGSSGGNLAIGLISYINEKGEGLPKPGKLYAGSPGTLLLSDEEKIIAKKQEKTDVIMSVQALDAVEEMSALNRDLKQFFDEADAEYPVWFELEKECGKYLK